MSELATALEGSAPARPSGVWNRARSRSRKQKEFKLSQQMRTAKPMTYKAYIDNIKAKTGKDPEYYRALANEKGLAKHSELLGWLKSDCGLGHGHANAIILYIQNPELAKRKILEDAKKEKAKK